MNVAYIVISFILCCVAGFSKAVMDTHAFHYNKSIFKSFKSLFFAEDSWRNKYKNGDKNQGEKFLGSTTIFVMFTDVWHLAGFFYSVGLIVASIMIGCSGIVTNSYFGNWLDFVNTIIGVVIAVAFVKIVSLLVFNLFYERVLIDK